MRSVSKAGFSMSVVKVTNSFPQFALIREMHETRTADWCDVRVTWQLTPLSL